MKLLYRDSFTNIDMLHSCRAGANAFNIDSQQMCPSINHCERRGGRNNERKTRLLVIETNRTTKHDFTFVYLCVRSQS